MKFFTPAFQTVRQYGRTFVLFNVAFYGLVIAGMAAAAIVPDLQQDAIAGVDDDLDQPGLASVLTDAYDSGNVFWAAALTFLINLILGSMLTTTLPSLIIPFFGVAFTVYRAITWGLLFAPIGPEAASLIPHYLTVLIEGQAYVITAFASRMQARMFLQPHRFGQPSRRAGYRAGLRTMLQLYPLITLLLLIGAIYEAFEGIYLIPLFE